MKILKYLVLAFPRLNISSSQIWNRQNMQSKQRSGCWRTISEIWMEWGKMKEPQDMFLSYQKVPVAMIFTKRNLKLVTTSNNGWKLQRSLTFKMTFCHSRDISSHLKEDNFCLSDKSLTVSSICLTVSRVICRRCRLQKVLPLSSWLH